MEFKRRTDCLGDRLAGRVVHGGPQAASGDDNVGTLQGFADSPGNTPGIVSDSLGAVQIHSQPTQGLRNEAGVRVGGLAEQEFGTDGNDFCSWHG
jgi:hypothetical protein